MLRAFFGPYGESLPLLAFAEKVTVAGQGGGRYIITNIILLEDNTNGAFWQQPQEVIPFLPPDMRVLRWSRVDADGDGYNNEIYLLYGNEETGQYAVWQGGRLHLLGGEVAVGNQIFKPALIDTLRDINGDGKPEITWLDWGADAGEMKVYAWDGQRFSGLFESVANRIELVDLDADGVLEIAVGNRPGALAAPVYRIYRWQDGEYVELPGTFRDQAGKHVGEN